MKDKILQGEHIRLEPLGFQHTSGLCEAAAVSPDLFRWTFVPQGQENTINYIQTALAMKDAGTAVPFAIIGNDGIVLGSTRYWNIQYWAWPENHPLHGKTDPDVCEIGHTWLTQAAIRTPVNTEAKLLLLTNAFESWKVLRVCFQTDVRNVRSRNAIERIGGKFEGIIRAERIASDLSIRDTARFSIVSSEWPEVKQKLIERLKVR